MNKTELIAEVANKAGLSRKDAEKALGAVVEMLSQNNSSDISQRFYRTLKMRGCSALAGRPLLLLQMTIKNGYFSEKSLEFDGGLWHNYLKLLHGKG